MSDSSGPPAGIPPNQLFQQLLAMPRAYRDVDIPRKDPATEQSVGKVRMQVLTQEEQEICAAEAEDFTRKRMKEIPKATEAKHGYESIYNNAASVEVLYRACRRIDDPKWPFFPTPAQMRKAMTADEIGMLMDAYITVQTELGPVISRMTVEEENAWIDVLAKGQSAIPLVQLSLDGLRTLAISLASRLYSSRTDTSSAGSPPDESGPDS